MLLLSGDLITETSLTTLLWLIVFFQILEEAWCFISGIYGCSLASVWRQTGPTAWDLGGRHQYVKSPALWVSKPESKANTVPGSYQVYTGCLWICVNIHFWIDVRVVPALGVILIYLESILLPLLSFYKPCSPSSRPLQLWHPPGLRFFIYSRTVTPLCLQGIIFNPLHMGHGSSPQFLQLALKLCFSPFWSHTWPWLKTAQLCLHRHTSTVRTWKTASSF